MGGGGGVTKIQVDWLTALVDHWMSSMCQISHMNLEYCAFLHNHKNSVKSSRGGETISKMMGGLNLMRGLEKLRGRPLRTI